MMNVPPQYPPPQQPGPNAGATEEPVGRPRYATGFFHPRWVLLAAICYMIAAAIVFGLHYYFNQEPCNLGRLQALCTVDLMPDPFQAALIWAGFMVVLFFASAYGRSHDPDEADSPSPLWRLTEYQRVRPMAWALAALIAVGLLVMMVRGWLNGVSLALAVICLFVFVCCASYHPPRPAPATTEAETPEQEAHAQSLRGVGTFWGVIRNTPPISWLAVMRHRTPADN